MSWAIQINLQLGDLALNVEMEGGTAPVAVVGPNGAGKTSLLRTIAGAHSPENGLIRLEDRTLFDAETQLSLPPEERRVGYVPQGFGLFPHLSVLDNVAFGWRARRPHMSRAAGHKAACALLEEMDSGHLSDRWPAGLSGGEQQRVALARALMIEPQILLLDEPFAALDIVARRKLRAFLAADIRSREIPAIVVTHDLRDVLALDARVYVLEQGQVVQSGMADELAREPATEFVEEFFRTGLEAGSA